MGKTLPYDNLIVNDYVTMRNSFFSLTGYLVGVNQRKTVLLCKRKSKAPSLYQISRSCGTMRMYYSDEIIRQQ